jgi:glycosyltransferase involved in cell wall biosynthesis
MVLMNDAPTKICVTMFAHNEAARIARALHSLPLDDPGVEIHVVVNGSTDASATIARGIAAGVSNVQVHEFEAGGKSRSWNRFVFETLDIFHPIHIFVDGDAEFLPGSVGALALALESDPSVNAAAGMPANGRRVERYREEMRRTHGLFGDLYAVRGTFLARMKAAAIRLPDDLIGDDSLIGALAKTDLGDERQWADTRIVLCESAGFLCEPFSWTHFYTWNVQYKRKINYSVRHFQNRIVSDIMRNVGPAGLPARLADLYPARLGGFVPRRHPMLWWFDRLALARMAAQQ